MSESAHLNSKTTTTKRNCSEWAEFGSDSGADEIPALCLSHSQGCITPPASITQQAALGGAKRILFQARSNIFFRSSNSFSSAMAGLLCSVSWTMPGILQKLFPKQRALSLTGNKVYRDIYTKLPLQKSHDSCWDSELVWPHFTHRNSAFRDEPAVIVSEKN